MEVDVLENFKEIGYVNCNSKTLEKAIEGGPKSTYYTILVEWLSKELQYFNKLDEHVNSIVSPSDWSSFMMELSSFLKELGCQYASLTTGHINDRLSTKQDRLLLLDYLLSELKTARMLKANKPELDNDLHVTLNESSTASSLKNLLVLLKFPKPPSNISPAILFRKVENTVKELVSKATPKLVGQPMLVEKLNGKQWHTISEAQKEMHHEYKMRRELLLTRLDVTINSFTWSDRLKNKKDEIEVSYNAERKKIRVEPNVKLSDILAAREDLAIIEKITSVSVRKKTQSEVNKVIIGLVPDRGGRPYEQEPPPPEMPSWQQRTNAGGGQGMNRGGGQGMNRGGGLGMNRGGGVGMNRGGGRGMNRGGYQGESQQGQSHDGTQNANTSLQGGRVQGNWNRGGYQSDRSQNGNYHKPGNDNGYQKSGQYQKNDGSYQNYSNRSSNDNSYLQHGFQNNRNQDYGGPGYSTPNAYEYSSPTLTNNYNIQSSGGLHSSGLGGYNIPGRFESQSGFGGASYQGDKSKYNQDRNDSQRARSNYLGGYQGRDYR